MSMEQEELHSILLHNAIDPKAPEGQAEFQALINSLLLSDLTQIKLPQGLNAPHINAKYQQSQQSYRVPVWSLRALRQMKRRPPALTTSGALSCAGHDTLMNHDARWPVMPAKSWVCRCRYPNLSSYTSLSTL
jgi:hypothetical protein